MLCIFRRLLSLVVVAVAATAMAAETDLMKETDPARLVAVLQSADAPLFDKAKACQRLAVIGTKDAVPVLARLLDDEKLAHYARFGLEAMPDPAVDDALRAAMDRLAGRHLVGVINSIGFRRDAKATEALIKRLGDSDVAVASAAASALGRIGTPKTSQALLATLAVASPELKPWVADACLACGEQLLSKSDRASATSLFDALRKSDAPKHHRLAATLWAIRVRQSDGISLALEQLRSDDADFFAVGLQACRRIPGPAMTKAMAAVMDTLPPARQALLVTALAGRQDEAAIPAALKAAKSQAPEVRAAAIRVLAKRADPAAVPVLLEAAVAADEAVAQAAQAGLASIPGKEADEAIVARLTAADAKLRRVAIELTGQRRIAAALPALLKAADDSDEQVRHAALKAIAVVIDPKDLSMLVERFLKAASAADKTAAGDALKAAAMRAPDREASAAQLVAAMRQAPLETKVALLEMLAAVGGKTALEAAAAAAKDPDENLQDAGTRVLGEWMSPDAGPVLLELAKSSANAKFKVRALRGYIRVARQLQMPMDQRAAMLRQALAVAWRDDERKLVLEVLTRERSPSPEYLAIAVSQLAVAGVKDAAGAAAVDIAEKLVRTDPGAIVPAMKQVVESGASPATVQKAKQLLNRAGRRAKQ
ncbi:MAG: HEAT repeat domain-containing protein [Thermoguttaceae bacterium]|jgi:HEAT repeat protein|nr:HEAT repeat domain-containing protein [Thermoguttaceae bacterium]